MSADVRGGDTRVEQLAAIERLLEQYRKTKDRETLRQAIELWDKVESARKRTTKIGRTRTH